MNNPIKKYYTVARNWFKNNDPVVQKWEQEGVVWQMHHWDTTLKQTNPKRYNMWMIEDLIPMTCSTHTKIHQTGKTVSEETRQKLSESHKGQEAWNKGKTYHTGHHHSEETKRKISEKAKNKTDKWLECHFRAAVYCVEADLSFDSVKEAQEWLNTSSVSYALADPKRTAGGYHWRYIDAKE